MISKSLDGASVFILYFVDWLGSFLWQRGVFGCSLHLITVLAPLYALCVLVCLFLLGIVNNILVCLSREREREREGEECDFHIYIFHLDGPICRNLKHLVYNPLIPIFLLQRSLYLVKQIVFIIGFLYVYNVV